jgi:hypothetical protein
MELDLQSLFGLHVHSCTILIDWDPANLHLPPHLGSYTRALLVSRAVRAVGVNILEVARHRIGLLQYNLSTFRGIVIHMAGGVHACQRRFFLFTGAATHRRR